MSRIGNKAVEIPDKVKVNIGDDGAVSVEGKTSLETAAQYPCERRRQPGVGDTRSGNAQRESVTRTVAKPGAQHGAGSERRIYETTRDRRSRVQGRRAGNNP